MSVKKHDFTKMLPYNTFWEKNRAYSKTLQWKAVLPSLPYMVKHHVDCPRERHLWMIKQLQGQVSAQVRAGLQAYLNELQQLKAKRQEKLVQDKKADPPTAPTTPLKEVEKEEKKVKKSDKSSAASLPSVSNNKT